MKGKKAVRDNRRRLLVALEKETGTGERRHFFMGKEHCLEAVCAVAEGETKSKPLSVSFLQTPREKELANGLRSLVLKEKDRLQDEKNRRSVGGRRHLGCR